MDVSEESWQHTDTTKKNGRQKELFIRWVVSTS